MDKPITTRLPEEFVVGIKEVSEKENIDMSTAIRKLLATAIKEWKIQFALKQYSKGNLSFEETADFAEVSVWDLPNLFKKHETVSNYDLEEFEEDLKTIEWKK